MCHPGLQDDGLNCTTQLISNYILQFWPSGLGFFKAELVLFLTFLTSCGALESLELS